MLSIGKLAAGRERYYTNSVAKGREDYYAGQGEAQGRWLGSGAKQAGVSGDVDPEDFSKIIAGSTKHGDSMRAATSVTRVDGYDLTFSAPKSVSVLYAVGDEMVSAAARDAHDEAVRQALGYLERHACKVRRGSGGRTVLEAEGVVAAAFRHRVSRAGDPQLHTHTIVANAGFADGKWSALDGRLLYAHARTAGFLYQATLRAELTRELGVEWLPVHNGMADIMGIDQHLLRHFSERSQEIEEHMNQTGERSWRAREIAALDTRKRKEHLVVADELRASWRARAEEQGLGQSELVGVLHRPPQDQVSDRELVAIADRLAGPGGVTRKASTFDRRDVLRDWAEAHRAGACVEWIERLSDAWLDSEVAVALPAGRSRRGLPGLRRYSTVPMIEVEQGLVDSARRRRGAGVGRASHDTVEAAIASRPTLTREQAVVVRGLARSGDGVQVLRAAAGTGKTFALDAARDAWQASGVNVVGCAVSARAAVELESQSAIPSGTVARLQRGLARGERLTEGSVLVVDEAGMVGSRQLAELAQQAERVGAKLVLVGDDHQLPEIDAGGALRGIAKRIGALELRTVIRQQHEWDRQALNDLRKGRIEEWARAYREHGRLISSPSAEASRGELVRDWWIAAREPGTEAAMIAHRRSDVADLNRRARELMTADKRLGVDEVTAPERSFAVGDQVLAKRNDRRLDIVNGARGTVTDVDTERRAVTVEVVGGSTVTLDSGYLDAGHLDHGYAMTAHAAQGVTVDKTFVLGSDDLYREWGYTALTRHRAEARYYTVSKGRSEIPLPGLEPQPDPLIEDVVEALGSSRRKELALDAGADDVDVAADRVPGTFAEMRALERDLRRVTTLAERARSETRDAQLRVGELQAELEATPRWKGSARAELRNAIAAHQRILGGWRGQTQDHGATLTDLDRRRALVTGPLLQDPEPVERLAERELAGRHVDLGAGLDIGP